MLWQSDNCFPGAEGGFVDSSPEGYHIADERYYGHPGGKKNNRIGKRYSFRQLFLEILYKIILRKLSKTYIAKRGLFR